MSNLKVVFYDKQKNVKLPSGIRMLLRRTCCAALEYEEFPDKAEVNISFVDDRQIHELNVNFRKIDKSTDVLSFPLGEDGVYDYNPETDALMLGDIVISVDHALAQAELYGHGTERELAFLTVHSMLHLLGYDHVHNAEEEKEMFTKQEEVLKLMGLEVKK